MNKENFDRAKMRIAYLIRALKHLSEYQIAVAILTDYYPYTNKKVVVIPEDTNGEEPKT